MAVISKVTTIDNVTYDIKDSNALPKTDLSNTISNDSTKALTPKAVYDAGFLTLETLPIYDGTVI